MAAGLGTHQEGQGEDRSVDVSVLGVCPNLQKGILRVRALECPHPPSFFGLVRTCVYDRCRGAGFRGARAGLKTYSPMRNFLTSVGESYSPAPLALSR